MRTYSTLSHRTSSYQDATRASTIYLESFARAIAKDRLTGCPHQIGKRAHPSCLISATNRVYIIKRDYTCSLYSVVVHGRVAQLKVSRGTSDRCVKKLGLWTRPKLANLLFIFCCIIYHIFLRISLIRRWSIVTAIWICSLDRSARLINLVNIQNRIFPRALWLILMLFYIER